MPTPVGPSPRDPNDPDFWDWADDEPALRRHPARAAVAVIVIVALVLLVVLTLV
jgi:uncharacterized membrane protein YidH (DUF202 family)